MDGYLQIGNSNSIAKRNGTIITIIIKYKKIRRLSLNVLVASLLL